MGPQLAGYDFIVRFVMQGQYASIRANRMKILLSVIWCGEIKDGNQEPRSQYQVPTGA